MDKSISINKQFFKVYENEYNIVKHEQYNNLIILEDLNVHERIISLINELSLIFKQKNNILFSDISNGGFIPIKCSENFNKVYIVNSDKHKENIIYNSNAYKIDNIIFECNLDVGIAYLNDDIFFDNVNIPFIICNKKFINKINNNYKNYLLSESNLIVCVSKEYYNNFYTEFHYFIEEDILKYDNLIHLTMIVKNAGDSFENILNKNLSIIDRWTILDTGSTDNTIDIIKKVLVGKKKGELFQEPFINFRDSRNRCLDLAGKKSKFLLTLDDTYIIKNDLRNFLNVVRGDQFSDSFSFYIKSNDVEYTSNRIIKSESGLRYKYKIHEVISPKNNVNVIIPIHASYIFDFRSDYMENRTMERKQYDLKILHEMVEEESDDSRALYYLGQTYNLIDKYELALKYFIERVEHPDEGFIQEKIDACFEAARISNFKLNKPWIECKKLYEKAYEMDKTRPDSLYFLGIHYYLESKNTDFYNNYRLAYEYFKKAFQIGYPSHCQYSLKPTLSFYFLPKFLTEICYYFKDYKLGQESSDLFLNINKLNDKGEQPFKEIFNEMDYDIIKSWNGIYKCLNIVPIENGLTNVSIPEKPYLCFLADGGFDSWTGKDIKDKGLGGSETFVIEMSKYIQKQGYFQVIVFCKTTEAEIYDNVYYRPFMNFFRFIQENLIHTCIIGRYSEYIPVCLNSQNIENVYFVLHDLGPTGIVIPTNNKFKKVFSLSKWHVNYFTNTFPALKDITCCFHSGIDIKLFNNTIKKIPYKFIYSSLANRGLLPLLEMWPGIIFRYPDASLDIYCDVNNVWVNNVSPDEMKVLKGLLNRMLEIPELNVKYWGFVNKQKLADAWSSSDIWFYPCTFLETFCHTALEAAISKTFVVTRSFAGLSDTVGDRGAYVESNNLRDPYLREWQENNLNKLFKILDDSSLKNELVEKNYDWALNMSWEKRAEDLVYNNLENIN